MGIPGNLGPAIRKRAQSGFTLIEMMIVIGIMSVLTVLVMSGVMNVRARAKYQYCQNNLREIGMALDCYSSLWKGRLLPTTGPEDDNLRPLYPDCIKEIRVFICPSTGNIVEKDSHLEDNASGGRIGGEGHSYEYLSYYLYDAEANLLPTPEIKTRASVDVRADKVWLVMEAMESGIPRMPDPTDNHWEVGGNVLFADSHVEWFSGMDWSLNFKNGNAK
jgi:prepilin-type N-terminal cleavage/methylation domain-containing protein/prepilin-type processing-associated H-X9-DG protein